MRREPRRGRDGIWFWERIALQRHESYFYLITISHAGDVSHLDHPFVDPRSSAFGIDMEKDCSTLTSKDIPNLLGRLGQNGRIRYDKQNNPISIKRISSSVRGSGSNHVIKGQFALFNHHYSLHFSCDSIARPQFQLPPIACDFGMEVSVSISEKLGPHQQHFILPLDSFQERDPLVVPCVHVSSLLMSRCCNEGTRRRVVVWQGIVDDPFIIILCPSTLTKSENEEAELFGLKADQI